jgi:hypothetical protein
MRDLTANRPVQACDQSFGTPQDILVVESHQQVARLLGHPRPVRVGRDPREPNAPGRELDEEQDVEPLREHGVDGEEVALEDARRLLAQELRPANREAPRCRLDPRLLQDRPDGARRELDTSPTSSPWIRR